MPISLWLWLKLCLYNKLPTSQTEYILYKIVACTSPANRQFIEQRNFFMGQSSGTYWYYLF